MMGEVKGSRIALVGVILGAAVGSTWVLLPQAFPRFGPHPSTLAVGTDSGAAKQAPAVAERAPGSVVAPAGGVGNGLPSAAPEAPRFDVARVGARGNLVAAGRATPGAEVVLLEGGQEIGRDRADARGEWVILPADPLRPGARELALLSRSPGADPLAGRDTVLLLVPEAEATGAGMVAAAGRPEAGGGTTSEQAIALLLPPPAATGDGPRVLQPPSGTPAAVDGLGGATRGRLALDIVDYDERGDMRFAGSATPGATLRLYVGERHVGDVQADASGRWHLQPASPPAYGRHRLRVDQLAAGGSVAARIEVPFQREQLPEDLLRDGKVVVQPGASLWRIARNVYGSGTRYTEIHQANRGQIRDPKLIYPGQVFAVPGPAEEGAATSATMPAAR